jgi:hypothetical protein
MFSADAGFLCEEAAGLDEALKETPVQSGLQFTLLQSNSKYGYEYFN